MKDIFTGARRNFAATGQMRYKNSYKRRLMDRTILGDICNANPENIKSMLGSGKGTKVELYVPGTVQIRSTTVDGGIVYQQMTDTTEHYTLNREAYWALRFRPEDKAFMPWDPKGEYFTNATDQMARFIEKEFGADIVGKVPSFNQGHNAGVTFGAFDLGAATNGDAVVLYKTQRDMAGDTGVKHRELAADFIVKLQDAIHENEGLSGGHVSVIIPSPVKHHIKTSELKYGGLMGERNIDLGADERGGRGEVRFLGTMDNTITLVENNIMFREHVQTYVKNGVKHTVYPIFAMMSDGCAFIDDTVFRDDDLKSTDNWDSHFRAKQVYDWPVVFPQMMAVGYVELANPAYDDEEANG